MTLSEMTRPSTPYRIATRGSMLALWQAHHVRSLLTQKGIATELNVIKTTGDVVQDRFLHEIGGKGLFVRELEEAMTRGEAAMAVHSLKDLPVNLPDGFSLPGVLPRHRSGDLLIIRQAVAEALGLGNPDVTADKSALTPNRSPLTAADFAAFGAMTIASSSLRRSCLLATASLKIKTVPVRGNVDTRLRKLAEGQFDAIILAEASVERLGNALDTRQFIMRPIDYRWFVPCAGQGALAIEMMDQPATAVLRTAVLQLSCEKTKRAVTMERMVLRTLGGDCTMPFGCHVTFADGIWTGRAVVLDPKKNVARAEISLPESDDTAAAGADKTSVDEKMVRALLNQLTENGVADVLRQLGLTVPPQFIRH